MQTKTLISSYDEINDTFVGKLEGTNGFFKDYDISKGVYLALDMHNVPSSLFVNNASEVLGTSKNCLENSNVKIAIECDSIFLNIVLFIEGFKIFSVKCRNEFGIPNMNSVFDSNCPEFAKIP